MTHVVTVQATGLSAEHAGQKWWEALGGLRGELDPQRLLAILVLNGLEVLGNHLEGLVPADGLELAAPALAHTLHGTLDAGVAVNVLHFGDALQAHVLEALVLVLARLDHCQTSVAHRALQHAVAQAVLVVVRKAQRFTGRGLGLSRAGSDARQARPRRASRSRGRSGLQKAATAEHGAPRFLLHTILLLSRAQSASSAGAA